MSTPTPPPGSPPGDELLVEAVASAHRPATRAHDPLAYHPAWHDLDAAGRLAAHDLARHLRTLEAALDPDGLSTTARAILAKLR